MAAKPQTRILRNIIPLTIPKFEPKEQHKHCDQIAISTREKIQIIEINKILFLKSDSNYTEIQMVDGKKIVSSITLKKYVNKLSSYQFIRVHNSYLINKSFLSCYLAQQNKIVLHNSQEIPVSKSKKEGLLNYLKTLMV